MSKKKLPKIKKALPPGAIPGDFSAGDPEDAHINLISYSEGEAFFEKSFRSFSKLKANLKQDKVNWIDVCGTKDHKWLEAIRSHFLLHRLAVEDVTSINQLPKVEQYSKNLFIVLRMLSDSASTGSEQVSLFICDNTIITFQERIGDCLAPLRERIRNAKGRIRSEKSDYLVYSIIDTIIDVYFPALESHADRLDLIEEALILKQEDIKIEDIYSIKKDISILKSQIRSHRDLMSRLMKDYKSYFSDNVSIYFRDCHDHCVQQLDLVETYRDACTHLMELSNSSLERKANEVMKLLTIVASIFIPLTFIAGIYGMNFESSPLNMPELRWYYGYPAVLSLMLVLALIMLVFFKKNKWF